MQGITAELGFAGYGRAIAMLEILAENGGMANDDFCPELSLTRPQSDLKFWARRFQLTPEETENIFDIFERYELITPWRAGMISAPMLKERLDTWTRRLKREKSAKPKQQEKAKGTETVKEKETATTTATVKDGEPTSKQVRSDFEAPRTVGGVGVTAFAGKTEGETEKPETVERKSVNLAPSVRWMMDYFGNFGPVPDRIKVENLFEGRVEEGVKAAAEKFRNKEYNADMKFPFSIFLKKFDYFYSPEGKTAATFEKEMASQVDTSDWLGTKRTPVDKKWEKQTANAIC